VADRRYSSSAWQRTRKAVLNRDGHVCMIRGPRCRGVATTVHHRIPSSQAPHLFFASENLVAACTACNYGGGSRARADNERRRIEQLEEIIVDQDQRIQQLLERLQQYEPLHPRPTRRRNPPKPAIY
jgi:5-methylcytosine-specific restriction endonuclease McrA